MTSRYPPDPEAATQPLLDARLHLMDRQMLDITKVPVNVVDDIEFSDPEQPGNLAADEPAPEVTAVLTGLSLATRIFGGRPPVSRLHRVSWGDVLELGVTVRLAVGQEFLDASWTERWVRDRLIGKIPGGRHDPQ